MDSGELSCQLRFGEQKPEVLIETLLLLITSFLLLSRPTLDGWDRDECRRFLLIADI